MDYEYNAKGDSESWVPIEVTAEVYIMDYYNRLKNVPMIDLSVEQYRTISKFMENVDNLSFVRIQLMPMSEAFEFCKNVSAIVRNLEDKGLYTSPRT